MRREETCGQVIANKAIDMHLDASHCASRLCSMNYWPPGTQQRKIKVRSDTTMIYLHAPYKIQMPIRTNKARWAGSLQKANTKRLERPDAAAFPGTGPSTQNAVEGDGEGCRRIRRRVAGAGERREAGRETQTSMNEELTTSNPCACASRIRNEPAKNHRYSTYGRQDSKISIPQDERAAHLSRKQTSYHLFSPLLLFYPFARRQQNSEASQCNNSKTEA